MKGSHFFHCCDKIKTLIQELYLVRSSFIQRYLVPGIVFQSVIVAGGYGTGRELVEFFLGLGAKGALLGLASAGLIWSAMCALTFEFARQFQVFNYKSFFQKLLGPCWLLFELAYIGVLLIVLSIVIASAGSIAAEQFGIPYNAGVAALGAYICFMLFKGNLSIERVLSFWTVALYSVFGTVFVLSLYAFGEPIGKAVAETPAAAGDALYQGVRYAGYNLGLIPAVLFTVRHCKERREAVIAGIIAGIVAIVPAFFIFLSILACLPEAATASVPMLLVLGKLQQPWLVLGYNVVMFMTLVETGIGLLHAFNERFIEEEKSPKRIYIGGSVLILSALIAQLGLIGLISQGYGMLTWVIIAVYLVPLATIGLYQLRKQHARLLQKS